MFRFLKVLIHPRFQIFGFCLSVYKLERVNTAILYSEFHLVCFFFCQLDWTKEAVHLANLNLFLQIFSDEIFSYLFFKCSKIELNGINQRFKFQIIVIGTLTSIVRHTSLVWNLIDQAFFHKSAIPVNISSYCCIRIIMFFNASLYIFEPIKWLF